MKPKIDKLSDKEKQWIAAQLQGAAMFVEAFSPEDANQPPTLAALDRAFAAWTAGGEADNQMVNATINCVGIAFGQSLVDGAGMSWVIATDGNGSDLAVSALPGRGDVLVYPANFVAKRWERRETGFLEAAFTQISQQVQTLNQDSVGGSASKPWWKFW